MIIRLCPAPLTLAIVLAVSAGSSIYAQQPTFLIPIEMKGQSLRGSIGVVEHENEGVIGINGKATAAGYAVETATPGGPAAAAGILPGDVIVALDGTTTKNLDASTVLKPIAQKRDGETLSVALNRNGQSRTIAVTVAARKRMLANDAAWQHESKLPPAISQLIFGGSVQVIVNLYQAEQYPNHAFLMISLYSKDAPSFIADDMKFFLLDGTGQQLRHVSLDEIKYGIQLSVAQNWKGGNYPPPPPPSPQRQYTISGMQNGNYTITNFGGGMGSVSGTSNSTYTVTPQPDYSQLGYALGLAIRRSRDARSNQKLLEQAKEVIASWEGPYFKSQSPVAPGETRSGQIMYWTGSNRRPEAPFRVILFLTDPRTQKEEAVTFAFGTGAERIKQEMERQSEAAAPTANGQGSLTNSDIVEMIKAGIGAEIVIAKIKTTSCSFETSPAALKELKDAGISDSVILAMVEARKD
jgi:membrane-associated protease RseP (regulator of RpoE activity)